MGQKYKATHGMVGGAQAGKAPELGGENVRLQFITHAPPMIPKDAEVFAGGWSLGGQVSGKQSSHSQQSRLPTKCVGRFIFVEGGYSLGEILHGPSVVFVAKRPKESMPERSFPSGLMGQPHDGL